MMEGRWKQKILLLNANFFPGKAYVWGNCRDAGHYGKENTEFFL